MNDVQGEKTVSVRVARWSSTHPWRAIVVWLLFIAAAVVVGNVVDTNQAGGRDFWVGEAGRAEAISAEGGLTTPPTERVLVTMRDESQVDAEADVAAGDVADRLDELPTVAWPLHNGPLTEPRSW